MTDLRWRTFTGLRVSRSARRVAMAAAAVLMIGGCSASGPGDQAGPITAPAVVTFQVAGDEQFKVELITQSLVDHAKALLDGEPISGIPIGTVVRGDAGPNAPWTWHLDPSTVEFAFATTEVCDGIPSFVEDATVTSPYYCPWSAKVIALAKA